MENFINGLIEKSYDCYNIPANSYSSHNLKKGLRNQDGTGVLAGVTRISQVHGYVMSEDEKTPIEGQLNYRGYDIMDLTNSPGIDNRYGFEEIAYLLLFGELPDKQQLVNFCEYLSAHRELPEYFAEDMILKAPSRNVMNKMARSVLAMYSYDDNPDDTSVENVLRQSIELIGYFPTLIAYAYQAKSNYYDNKSLHLHYPVPEFSTAENILRMIRPDREFTQFEARMLDLSLILHAEHGGGNNSSFTTHLISSSGTDTYSAMAAAVGSLKGPRHGGANINVINMLADLKANVKDISNERQLEDYFVKVFKKEANDGSGLVYGLGHAIYTISDPRATLLKGMAKQLAEHKGMQQDFALCEYIENKVPDIYGNLVGEKRNMPANVDLYSGFVYSALNIPPDLATPLFANARLSGWCAHRLEELISGKKLMRPAYVGIQPHRDYIKPDQR